MGVMFNSLGGSDARERQYPVSMAHVQGWPRIGRISAGGELSVSIARAAPRSSERSRGSSAKVDERPALPVDCSPGYSVVFATMLKCMILVTTWRTADRLGS
jgi:hypothetical protein